MKRYIGLIWGLLALSCMENQESKRRVLYESPEFTLYSDGVEQGDNKAEVISAEKITSNYKSPEASTYPRKINFKFSINQKDNELPVGDNHSVIINSDETESPVKIFGDYEGDTGSAPDGFLPVNYKYTFKMDARPVLESFEEKGYYENFNGTKIAKEDFKGFYIAGGQEPLSWDFVGLKGKGLEMKDEDGDGIYSITLLLNPYDEEAYSEKTWTLSEDISSKPRFKSDLPIVDALFNMSLEEAILNIEDDSTLRTGAKWEGVWTRDISYSIFLAFAYHEPEVAKISLRKKIKNGRIIQDTGSGGAWPVSSDRVTWVMAAWEIYLATGDEEWLKEVYPVIKRTLNDDHLTIKDHETGMYKGESSFLDWREQSYPKWMDNKDIYQSLTLGTNAAHFRAHEILSQMVLLVEGDQELSETYQKRAEEIKQGMLNHLWQEDKGYFAQYLYGRSHKIRSDRFEALGESLSVLFGISDVDKSSRIIAESPITPYGVTCIYPQIPNIPPYHNNGIWPFVQSYWNLAAAKAGNEKVLLHGLASVYRAGGLFLTNYENFVADNGDFLGTEINSHRMLWSMAGNLAMVHRVFMGMSFSQDGILFNPVVPENYGGTMKLENFKYRNAILNITVNGYGNQIDRFELDGKKLDNAFISSDLVGEHEIVIELNEKPFNQMTSNISSNQFTLTNPIIALNSEQQIIWKPIDGAESYLIYRNGKKIAELSDTLYAVKTSEPFSEFAVSAIDNNGVESFISNPVWYFKENNMLHYELENFAGQASEKYTDYSGLGFVKIDKDLNNEILIEVEAPKEGEWLMDVRYSNGTGPWNSDNNCAIRSLWVEDNYAGVLIFPQRGLNEWSDWGRSNSVKVQLKKGLNRIKISFEDWNENMDGNINEAMLDSFRLIYLQ